ncbi:Lrp/AsnC family transcriptional regulator [Vibrio profundum]|uniref:Lrp/AsnC family transcriptional regulator n=1 Tax=Vibrio profundum TaxID=2910247 RepID=UPI003D099385
MDRFDEKILQELKMNGKIANVELANLIGLSPSATLRRVQDLEKKGVIKGYQAILDKKQLGVGFIAYVSVGLVSHSRQAQLEFQSHIEFENEVTECHIITGENEYLLRVETTSLDDYHRFHSEVLGECKQVKSIATMVVMNSPKDER